MIKFNLDGDSGTMMEEIDLINKRFSCIDMCEWLNSKLVGVDGSVSSVYYPVTDNIYVPQHSGGNHTGLCHVANFGLGGNEVYLFVCIIDSFRLVSEHSAEVAIERTFKLGDGHISSDLKIMVR